MCVRCAADVAVARDAARRRRILDLLALVEHPDALPPGAALRLGREIMSLIGPCADRLRCDSTEPDAVAGESR